MKNFHPLVIAAAMIFLCSTPLVTITNTNTNEATNQQVPEQTATNTIIIKEVVVTATPEPPTIIQRPYVPVIHKSK